MAIKKEKLKTYAQFLLENIQQHRMTDLSAQSAYFLILALFPFIVVVFNLLTMFAADHIDKILSFLSVLPEETVNAGLGDCIDGSLLIKSLTLIAGIPDWKVKIIVGKQSTQVIMLTVPI